ncbi:putative repeat protein (TIGR01451 family), partial [Luteimonas sp. RC10]|nr:putative repeat protein (TIGR01451 family) [Luteimonas sp. RC10]
TTPGGGTTTSPPDEEDVTLETTPSLTVVKTASTPSGNTAGSTIAYSFLVTNTGNVTIANIAIDDDKLDAAAVCPVTTLAPGASTTCTGTHTITQAEVDAGEVLNTATATGTTPGGGTTTSPPDEEDVTIERNPGMATNKALAGNADEDGSGTVTLGDTLTYTITATNTGTVSLGNVEVRDDRITPSSLVCASLAPGASCVLTGTYVVTQADVNAGQVVNTAVITTDEPAVCPAGDTSAACQPSVTIDVTPYEIVANDDSYGPVNGATGNPSVGNVLDNDTLNGVPATIDTVTITLGTLPTGIVVDPSTGVVGVAPGTPASSYTFDYTICEVLNPANCDTATVTVVVEAAEIVANDDSYGPVNGATGNPSVGNVLDNDTLNGVPATIDTATITLGTLPTGIVVDPSTGVVGVAPGTPAGTYTFDYTICEVLNPSNCDTATVTVVVEAAEIVANDDNYGPVNGATGNPSVGNILDNDTLNGVPATIDTVKITVGELRVGVVVDPSTGVVGVAPGTPAGTYTFEYTICELLNPDNCDTATVTVVVEAAEIVANDDSYGPVNGATGDPSVGNVLDNDTLNGVPATLDTVTITVGTLPTGIVVDPSTGVVGVSPGTPAGSYTFEYTICEVLNPSNCDTATVTVVVEAAEIVATDDSYGPVNGATGDPSVGNVLDNDTLNGVPATPDTVTITVGTLPPGIVVDPSTGVVGVAPGTPAGSYTFEYTICEVLNPDNCDTATVTVDVEAAEIVATDDNYGPVNGATGDPSVGNVLDNDTLNGVPATPDTVTITVGTLPTGIVVDPSTGVVGVSPGTPVGSYTFEYTICEVLNPDNCDTATVTVDVEAAEIVATDDNFGPVNGATGDPSVGNVLDNDTLNGVPATIDTVTITVGTLPTGIVVDPSTGVVSVSPGTPAGSYTFEYTICEVLNPENCDTASVTVVVEAPEITAADDSTTTDQNTPVTIPVLDNDTLNGVPVDADDVTVVELTPPANGSIVIQPDGTVVYTPNPGFSGDDSFEYRICEITNPENCATATVTVTVRPNIVEAIDDDAGTAEPGVPTPVVVVDNDTSTGAPLDPGSVTILTPPQHGQVSCANGTCSYTPAFGYNGEDSFVYRVCDTSYPAPVCDTATVTVKVQGEAPLRITKTAAVREVKVGDLVRYTLTVENVSNAMVSGAHVLDTPPQGFSYVDGSLSSGDGRALAVSGHNPIRISSLDLAPGDTMSISYLLRVGAGIRAGSHINQAVAQSESGVPLSNIATAQVGTAFDPLLDDSLVFGTVFDDRNGDGWQASAVLTDVRVQGGFAPEAYVAGSTTIDRGDGPQPVADASAPLLHGMALGTITGRQSVGDPVEAHQVVIRQRLRSATFAGDFVLTSAQGVTVRMAADGSTQVEREGEAAKGLSAAEPTVTRRVMQEADGLVVEYVIANSGIDERGIPGVRIASVEGLLIETDQYGRYHLVDVPGGNAMHGRNFILKVDPSTLPPGAEFTTANPLVRRVTPGLPVRFDFGVKLPVIELQAGREAVELELGEVFFAPDSSELREAYLPAIEAMAGQIDRYRGGRVVVTGEGEHEALAFARAAAVRDALQSRVAPDAAAALTVEMRTRVEDPHAMVAGVGNGGVLLGTVLFDTDKSAIRPEFEALLDAVAQRLEALGGGTVGIVGHTDVRGSHAYNVDLGLRRAQSVFDALSGRLSPQVRAKTRVEASRDPAAPVGEARK